MLNELCESRYNRNIGECSDKELYFALLELVKNMAVDKEIEYIAKQEKKKVYYISAEFLM